MKLRCSPVGRCSCWTAASVILPSISLKQRMASESSISESAAKIALPFGCAHQPPMIGAPATTSAMFGTAPRADASITPFFSTRRTHFEPRVAGLRGVGLALEERFALAGLALAGFAFAGLALGRTFVRVFSFFLGIAS